LEHFPFMKLPPEIRLMVYEIAINDNIAAAMPNALAMRSYKPNRHPYLGALALVHTTSIIRNESRNAMHAVAHRQWEDLCARSKERVKVGWSRLEYARYRARCFIAGRQSYWVKNVCTALEEVRLSKAVHS